MTTFMFVLNNSLSDTEVIFIEPRSKLEQISCIVYYTYLLDAIWNWILSVMVEWNFITVVAGL